MFKEVQARSAHLHLRGQGNLRKALSLTQTPHVPRKVLQNLSVKRGVFHPSCMAGLLSWREALQGLGAKREGHGGLAGWRIDRRGMKEGARDEGR
jgi:hypothetical protein